MPILLEYYEEIVNVTNLPLADVIERIEGIIGKQNRVLTDSY